MEQNIALLSVKILDICMCNRAHKTKSVVKYKCRKNIESPKSVSLTAPK